MFRSSELGIQAAVESSVCEALTQTRQLPPTVFKMLSRTLNKTLIIVSAVSESSYTEVSCEGLKYTENGMTY